MTIADLWAALPLLILAVASLLVLLLGASGSGRHGTLIGAVALSGAAAWALLPPPSPIAPAFGISCTPFARFFTIFFTLTAAAALLLSHHHNKRQGIHGEEYPATVLFAAFGMVTLSTSTNLLMLFLGLEALTFAFYILVAIDRSSPASAEAGLKYLLLGAIAAAFIAFGIGLIFCAIGTLSITPAIQAALQGRDNPLALAGWGLLLIGTAFKISLVPAHLWTPDVYQGAPAPVVAFLSTGSKAASFSALLLLLMSAESAGFLHAPLWAFSFLSMTVGNFAALLQSNLKRMLAYSSIAQMGYVTLALLTGNGPGFEAVVFYLVAYTAMNLAAFGVIATLACGEKMTEVDDYRGLGYERPFTGGILALAMLGLAGIPPTAGFMGKFFIFAAAIRGGEVALAIIGILTAAVSAFYYLRVVVNLYMRQGESAIPSGKSHAPEMAVLGCSAAVIAALGIWPAPLLRIISLILH